MWSTSLPKMACWLIMLGVIAGLAAIGIGWRDWLAIPSHTRAKTIGLVEHAQESLL